MSLIVTLPDNKLGVNDNIAVDAICNSIANNGNFIKQLSAYDYTNSKFNYLLGNAIIPNETVLTDNGFYHHRYIISVSDNSRIIPPVPQLTQYHSNEPRCYTYHVILKVESDNIDIEFYNMVSIGTNQNIFNTGTYHITIKYYIDGSCFYRILK